MKPRHLLLFIPVVGIIYVISTWWNKKARESGDMSKYTWGNDFLYFGSMIVQGVSFGIIPFLF